MFNLLSKNILITGCCGTVGDALLEHLAINPGFTGKLIGIDNDESKLFFQDQKWLKHKHVQFLISDIRDIDSISSIMKNIDVVFHCAAFKHVVLTERSPDQALKTNILGTQNIITASKANNVELVVFTSSDKAVNPTNVMGTSKLMCERLMTAANNPSEKTIFTSVRFGNILGSNGSVVPIFKNQILNGGPVTITDPAMTRFIMSVSEAVKLIVGAASIAKGGEVIVTKMPVIRIQDLATAMIKLFKSNSNLTDNVEVSFIGAKPGEKLYEELMNDEELRRSWDVGNYFVVLPAYSDFYGGESNNYEGLVSKEVLNVYNSRNERTLSIEKIENFLVDWNLIDLEVAATSSRYWPGDKEKLQ